MSLGASPPRHLHPTRHELGSVPKLQPFAGKSEQNVPAARDSATAPSIGRCDIDRRCISTARKQKLRRNNRVRKVSHKRRRCLTSVASGAEIWQNCSVNRSGLGDYWL